MENPKENYLNIKYPIFFFIFHSGIGKVFDYQRVEHSVKSKNVDDNYRKDVSQEQE